MATRTAKKKPTAAEAKRDREFAQHQAGELARMRRAQERVAELSRSLKRATARADRARVAAAMVLVDQTDYMVIIREDYRTVEKQLVAALDRVTELSKDLNRVDRTRELAMADQ